MLKVYRIVPFARPKEGRHKAYACLCIKKPDEQSFAFDNFVGIRLREKWRTPTLYFDRPLRPKPDFPLLGIGFACNERAMGISRQLLDSSVEFLPAKVEGESQPYFVFNPIVVGDFLNREKTVFATPSNEMKEILKELIAAGKNLNLFVAPAFDPDKVRDLSVFRIQESNKEIYCVEDETNPSLGFKGIVEQNSLTGLRFDLAWTEATGAIPLTFPPMEAGAKWITGDGNEFPNWKTYRPA